MDEISNNNNNNTSTNEQDRRSAKKIKLSTIDHSQNSRMGELKICTETTTKLSKRQRKKIFKKQKWLENLPAKRAKEKARLKQRKQEARDNNTTLGPSRKALKRATMSNSNCKVRVVIDLSFDHLMTQKDISKCSNQLMRCYSINRRAVNPLQFYVTNFSDQCKTEMQKHNGYQNWDINFSTESYLEIFKKEELIYLTSDSENVITSLEDDKVYIIGGIVDHNGHKGLCYSVAQENGISHGQLPIRQFLNMKTSRVLAINHVFEILLGVANGVSWSDALLKVLPARKGATNKGANRTRSHSSNSDDLSDLIENTTESKENQAEAN